MKYIFVTWILFFYVATLSRAQGMSAPVNEETSIQGLLEGLNIQTGDLILFEGHTFNARMTQLGTLSPFSHSGMVIREEDGSLWLTHATDNDYDGYHLSIPGEKGIRGGVLLTLLENSFLNSGFYRRIYLVRWDEGWAPRPVGPVLVDLYQKYKNFPFEQSKMRFILAAFDLRVLGNDLFSFPDTPPIFCSEYLYTLLQDMQFPVGNDQPPNEITPKDIRHMPPYQSMESVVLQYRKGTFTNKLTKKKRK